jgi:hypothetical protein
MKSEKKMKLAFGSHCEDAGCSRSVRSSGRTCRGLLRVAGLMLCVREQVRHNGQPKASSERAVGRISENQISQFINYKDRSSGKARDWPGAVSR